MRFTALFLATAAVVLGQDSVSATGAACEPHGDHWLVWILQLEGSS